MLTQHGLRTWASCYERIAEQVYEHFAAQHRPLAHKRKDRTRTKQWIDCHVGLIIKVVPTWQSIIGITLSCSLRDFFALKKANRAFSQTLRASATDIKLVQTSMLSNRGDYYTHLLISSSVSKMVQPVEKPRITSPFRICIAKSKRK